MRRIADSCRFVDNKALALQKARYEQGEKKRVQHPGSRDENLAREGRDTPGWPVDRTTRVVGSRNPPKRRRGGSMPRLSAVGISGLQTGEDVNGDLDRPGVGAEGLIVAHDLRTDVAGTGADVPNRALVAGDGAGGEDEDVAAAEMDEELAREEAVDAAALLALSAGGEQRAVTCGDLGKVGKVEEDLGVGDVTGAGAGLDEAVYGSAGEADVASVAYGRGNDAGYAGKVRGEASDNDHALRLAADNGNAEGDVGFTAGATCLAGIG